MAFNPPRRCASIARRAWLSRCPAAAGSRGRRGWASPPRSSSWRGQIQFWCKTPPAFAQTRRGEGPQCVSKVCDLSQARGKRILLPLAKREQEAVLPSGLGQCEFRVGQSESGDEVCVCVATAALRKLRFSTNHSGHKRASGSRLRARSARAGSDSRAVARRAATCW